jgi:predicted ATPase
MFVTRLILKNWKNFRQVDIGLREITYIVGPNASGKSNLLDVFRFLRDVAKPTAGGLQTAVAARGGISRIRCLHARGDPEVRIEVHLAESEAAGTPKWRYVLGFKHEGHGAQRTIVSDEQVWQDGEAQPLVRRPTEEDINDKPRLTQTWLEDVQNNGRFRGIAAFFADATYLHVVPQLLKFGDQIGGRLLDNDPFGQALLESIARTPDKTRTSRLKRIEQAMKLAIPRFTELKFERDKVTGRPHLEVRYQHYRPNAGWQREDQWSDGTLRLFGLLWSLLDTTSLLLIEEPELSLHLEIVRQIPAILDKLQRNSRRRRQILLTTHSDALLDNEGIDPRAILRVNPITEGSEVHAPDEHDLELLRSGLSPADVIMPKTRPGNVEQLRLAI